MKAQLQLLCLALGVTPAGWCQTQGLTPAWDIRQTLQDLVKQSQRITPILDELKPADWIAKGASETYVEQHKSVRAEILYLRSLADELMQKPDSLPTALQMFLRLQNLEALLDSMSQGVRRYQNPALADLMQATISENDSHGVRLREYLVELAETREAEFRIADEEAQRCRGSIIRQPKKSKKQP